MEELTREDWTEIYYALDSKKKDIVAGKLGAPCLEWAGHLGDIMEKIGPDGENMQQV